LYKKIIIITTLILSLVAFVGYMLNKHMKTITDYSNNGISKTIWVSDLDSVKAIPNYSKKEGFELVWKSDYEKYKQGYCLQENKIFSDEELFRRGIIQYIDKWIIVRKKILIYRWGSSRHSKKTPVGYYALSGIDSTNWYEKFTANYDRTKKSGLRDMLFDTFDAKPANINELLTTDMSDMTAGFKKPVAQSYGDDYWHIFLDKSFLLIKEDDRLYFHAFSATSLISGREIYIGDKLGYEDILKNREAITRTPYEIDYCGNVNYYIEKEYLESTDS